MITLHSTFLLCAAIGGTVLIVQIILMLLGFHDGADGDFSEFELDEAGAGTNIFFTYLSVKTAVAFLTFFGLTGLGIEKMGVATGWQVGLAFPAGCVAFYIVGFIMMSLRKLESKGNVDLNNGVGQTADVYLVIPADKSGAGKVTVTLQERSLQVDAMTEGDEIKTGAKVRVLGMIDTQTYDVVPV